MYETQCCRGGELRPVVCTPQPVEIFPQEAIARGSAIGECVGEGDGGVVDRVAVFEGFLLSAQRRLMAHFCGFEDCHVGFVVLIEEVEVNLGSPDTRKDIIEGEAGIFSILW